MVMFGLLLDGCYDVSDRKSDVFWNEIFHRRDETLWMDPFVISSIFRGGEKRDTRGALTNMTSPVFGSFPHQISSSVKFFENSRSRQSFGQLPYIRTRFRPSSFTTAVVRSFTV